MLEKFEANGRPTIVEPIDVVDVGRESNMPPAPVTIYGNHRPLSSRRARASSSRPMLALPERIAEHALKTAFDDIRADSSRGLESRFSSPHRAASATVRRMLRELRHSRLHRAFIEDRLIRAKPPISGELT